jgi:hypothetical protein
MGGNSMDAVVSPYKAQAVTSGAGVKEAQPSIITTTLYDLVVAIQDVVGSDEDALVVATLTHLLESGQIVLQRERS